MDTRLISIMGRVVATTLVLLMKLKQLKKIGELDKLINENGKK
ncbi:hypothetical protein [Kistimonas asteriae]|nr:hypothetical protein [Kistimonas asteriae]